jgi:hypothetical protein
MIVAFAAGVMLLLDILQLPDVDTGAPPAAFSAARAVAHVSPIAAAPHPAGSARQAAVAEYLTRQLDTMGLELQRQQTSTGDVRLENVLSRIPGSQSTGDVLMLAHYDSVSEGPGAADNASGSAVLLESARALAIGVQLRNDIVVLFDDGEELGFLGSRAFLAEHPWADDIRFVISIDTAAVGPPVLVDVQPQNGRVVSEIAGADAEPVASSFVTELLEAVGDEFDFQPFEEAGIPGVAIEDIYAFREQHTPDDLPALVEPAAMQAMGEVVVAIARDLASRDLSDDDSLQAPDRVFLSLPAARITTLPAWIGPAMVAASALMLVLLVVRGRREGALAWRRAGRGAAKFAVLVISVSAAAVAVWALLPEKGVHPTGSGYYLGALLGLATLGAGFLYRRLLHQMTLHEVWLAPLVAFLVASILVAALLPTGSYVFALPLLVTAAISLVLLRSPPTDWLSLGLLAAATPILIVVYGLPVALLYLGNAYSPPGLLLTLFALFLGLVLPQIALLVAPAAVTARPAGHGEPAGRGEPGQGSHPPSHQHL